MSKRNAHAVAARRRKAGPHSDKKRPEDNSFNDWVHGREEWEEEELLEYAAAWADEQQRREDNE